jgi:hypothetical protein
MYCRRNSKVRITGGDMRSNLNALNSRILYDLLPNERAEFDDPLDLCATNTSVNNINLYQLGKSNNPILTLPAMYTGPGATKVSEDTAEGLESKLLLMIGAKVMLT